MCMLPQLTQIRDLKQLEAAASVLFSPSYRYELNPTELARSRGVHRSTVYRQAFALLSKLDNIHVANAQIARLTAQNKALQQQVSLLQQQLSPYHAGHWVQVTPEKLAKEVEPIEGSTDFDSFALVDALAAVWLREKSLGKTYEDQCDSRVCRIEQSLFLDSCEELRMAQSKVQNAGAIEEKFRLLVGNQVRTSSRVEALNRRLRGFTDAKRHVTERQLRLMQLHHNTTRFSADAKRAGKSPWEWLELDREPGRRSGA